MDWVGWGWGVASLSPLRKTQRRNCGPTEGGNLGFSEAAVLALRQSPLMASWLGCEGEGRGEGLLPGWKTTGQNKRARMSRTLTSKGSRDDS